MTGNNCLRRFFECIFGAMFNDLKVIELASVLAGPLVGQFFAELGAEVIKVENPASGGDVTRSWLMEGEEPSGTISAYFCAANWGKKSVLIDLTSEQGIESLHKLVDEADIVIASYKPGDAKKLSVDYETLSKINPQLIYGHVTGYGPDDPRVGYDAVIQAESGFMSMNGEKDGGPLKMPVALTDVLAAHHLKEGLLLALIQRMKMGKGSYVPVALIDAAVSSLANQATNYLIGGRVPGRRGNEHPNIAPYGDVFETADKEQIILAVGNDRQFEKLCEVIGLDEFSEFSTGSERLESRGKLNLLISKRIRQFQAASLLESLQKQGVPAGSIRSMDQVFNNAGEKWLLAEGNYLGLRSVMASPDFFMSKALSLPPQLGEHTSYYLS